MIDPPSEIHIETALTQFAGTQRLLTGELRRAASEVPGAGRDLDEVLPSALEAIAAHARWLEERLADDRRDGFRDPRLGADLFSRKLALVLDTQLPARLAEVSDRPEGSVANPLKPEVAPPRIYVPVVADFVTAARQEFKFVPRFPQSETEFKRGYAKVALAAGLTRDQIVRIYGFEATGNGSYDIEAGLEYNKHGRAITTALGYNQLLATNSVEILAEKGDEFVKQVLSKSALASGAGHQSVDGKIDVLRRMVAFARSVSDAWGQHEILANTPKGLAVHALNLDLDVGPMLQTQKLLDSIVFARRKGFSRTLTAAELEMMNLTGDGNGFDMVTMPLAWRDQVPTANFFRPSGYADNPVAQRNNVVAKLIAATDERMDEEIKKPGARELAAYLQ